MKLKLLIWLNAENWCQNDFTLENCIGVESIRGEVRTEVKIGKWMKASSPHK